MPPNWFRYDAANDAAPFNIMPGISSEHSQQRTFHPSASSSWQRLSPISSSRFFAAAKFPYPFQKKKKKKRQPPRNGNSSVSPPKAPALPLVGTLPLIGMEKAAGLGAPPHIRMAKLANVYGDVMQLKMGRQTWIVLSSPQAVHNAFVEKGADFSGRPMVPSMRISAGGARAGFSVPEVTPRLQQLRQTATTRLFDAAQVERAHKQLEDEAHRLSDYLLQQSKQYGSAELRPALRRAATNCVLRYTFSQRVPYSAMEGRQPHQYRAAVLLYQELARVVDQIWTELTATDTTILDLVAPDAITNSPNAYRNLRRLVQRRDAILRQLVVQRRKERVELATKQEGEATAADSSDMLDALLDAGLPDDDIHYTLVDMFVAGVNTVSTQLEWFLLLLTTEPKEQTFTRNGLDKVGQEDYLQHVIKEVLRMKPPLLLPRKSVMDSTIQGYKIPKDTIVFANSRALCHNNEFWRGQDTQRFRPDRWYYEEKELKKGGPAACKFLPYSIGKRVCPGSRLADAELSIMTRVLLQRLRWKAPDGQTVDLSEDFSLTLVPKVSQSLRFETTD
eukprot:CAMPEP_0168740170 /NCGR_PEP_ID=MMETSP0724-20121128/11838_1 /TAXON_ID=265536 /ORGANISM="Amphiprora sp., Strain CCMP467" /LENGTH=560 /DNA_ID=CAMNT_0008787591 /DNA_START=89 /DNA_END=1772 /DNA_ORIENTATION=-